MDGSRNLNFCFLVITGGATSRPKAASAKGLVGGVVLPPPPGGASATGSRLPTSVSGGSLAINDSSVMRQQQPEVDNLLLGDFAAPPPLSNSVNPNQNQSVSGSGLSDFDDWGDFAAPSKPNSTVASSGNWEQF